MEKIDFVITWVDSNDPNWQKSKALYQKQILGDARQSRYRDWDTLRYWFRGVEKYANWVNKVYFVTCGHYPEWLNLDNPKLELVCHSEFIPRDYLPTFSCRTIEFNLHRIPGLSENFVYFNDDMYLTNYVKKEDFFVKGLPCDTAILDAICVTGRGKSNEEIPMQALYTSLFYNIAIINKHFVKDKVIKENFTKWFNYRYGISAIRSLLLLPWSIFPGLKSSHLPYSYLKTTFEEVWNKEKDILEIACSHKFRDVTDVSSRLLSDWQIVTGNFFPRTPKIGRQFFICDDNNNNDKVYEVIKQQRYKMICVNDEYSGTSFEEVKRKFQMSFDKILPTKSTFER